MVRTLKQALRMLFAIQACGILYVLFVAHRLLGAPDAALNRLGPWSYAIGLAVLALYTAAFWTTRAPLARPNLPALTACLLDLCVAIFFLRHATPAGGPAVFNATIAMASVAGFFVFSRRETASASAIPPGKPALIPGDRTWRGANSVVTLLFVAAAFILERAWNQWAQGHGMHRPAALLMLAAIAIALTITAVIHESGHALAGAAFGMTLLALTIGPLRFARRDGYWKLRRSKQIFGGSVSSAPTHADQPAWQDFLMVFAGPLANLCSTPLFVWLTLRSPHSRLAHLWFLFSFLATLSVVVAVLNLIPFRTAAGSYSDGARLLQMLTRSPVVEYQRALRALKSTLVTSLRPRDLDAQVFQRAAALRPREYAGLHAHICAAQVLQDQGHIAEAAAEIAAAEAIDAGYDVNTPALLYCVPIYFEAVHNRDAAQARRLWERMNVRNPDRTALDYSLAHAALAWVEDLEATGHEADSGDAPMRRGNSGPRANGAEAAWREASTIAQSLPPCGATDFTCDRLALLRNLLNESERLPDPNSPRDAELQAAAPTAAIYLKQPDAALPSLG